MATTFIGRKDPFERLWSPPRHSIKQLLLKHTTAKARVRGSLYVFVHPRYQKFVKIGWTSQNVTRRLRELGRQCTYTPTLALAVPNVPNAYRVEQLIFRDLAKFRYRETACSCCVEHVEWFKMDVGTAKREVLAWCKFVKAIQPYDRDGVPSHNLKNTIVAHQINNLSGDHLALKGLRSSWRLVKKRHKRSTPLTEDESCTDQHEDGYFTDDTEEDW